MVNHFTIVQKINIFINLFQRISQERIEKERGYTGTGSLTKWVVTGSPSYLRSDTLTCKRALNIQQNLKRVFH